MSFMAAIPVFDKKKSDLFREERNGYFSFNLKTREASIPWLINQTGWKVLSLCNGQRTALNVIERIHQDYKNIAFSVVQEDVCRIFGDLTRMQILKWRNAYERSNKELSDSPDRGVSSMDEASPMEIAICELEVSAKTAFSYTIDPALACSDVGWNFSKPSEGQFQEISYVDGRGLGCFVSLLTLSKDSLNDIFMLSRIVCQTGDDYTRLPSILRQCGANVLRRSRMPREHVTLRLVCTNVEKEANPELWKLLNRTEFSVSYKLRTEQDYHDVECHDFFVARGDV